MLLFFKPGSYYDETMRAVAFFLIFLCLFSCQNDPGARTAYRIGRDPSWYPLELGSQSALLNAFINAYFQKIGEEGEANLQIHDTNWSHLFDGLNNKEYAAILTSINPDPETNRLYTFSDPFLLLGPVLVVPHTSSASSLEDLHEQLVGINQFDNSVLLVQQHPTILIQTYQNMPTALDDLAEGLLDGVLLNTLDATALVPHLYSDRLKIVTPPLTDKALRLITLKGKHPYLIKNFNIANQKLEMSGETHALFHHFLVMNDF